MTTLGLIDNIQEREPQANWLAALQSIVIASLVATGVSWAAQTGNSQKASVLAQIPSDVQYTILGSNNIPGIKRGLDVRLNRKVSEEILRAIATKLKDSDAN